MHEWWTHPVTGASPGGGEELAPALYRLATEWAAAFDRRRAVADTALASWTGPAATEFADRMAAATVASDRLCAELRSLAGQWALAAADGGVDR
ncbi:MAG: hypothetical protein ACFCVK_11995 [Acidimicrobiales bacterium]